MNVLERVSNILFAHYINVCSISFESHFFDIGMCGEMYDYFRAGKISLKNVGSCGPRFFTLLTRESFILFFVQ